MSPWLPKGGGDFDVIAVGVQESKYSVKSKKSGADGAAADNADADSADDEAEEGGAAAPAAESKTESVSQRSGSNDPCVTAARPCKLAVTACRVVVPCCCGWEGATGRACA